MVKPKNAEGGGGGGAGAGAGGTVHLVSMQDMFEREKKYMQRLQDVGVSSAFAKESTNEFARLEEDRVRREHWEHHIRCDGLPRPYLPPEVRTFLAKKRHYQKFDAEHTVDWTLSVDERTVLTQNIFRTDRTRSVMKQRLDDHVGDRFESDISMYLDTLIKIDCMLDNAAEMERVHFARQMEIMGVRRELEQEIDASFDRLTYRIIRMDGVYMNSEDAMVATWSHQCPRYAIDIWALRNVPIRFKEMIAPLLVAELNVVGVNVQMPLSVLHDCLTLRCIHTNFDNYSQYAKSFDPVIPEGPVEVNAGIVDIEECLVNEWLMQLDIQQELLDSMLEKREIYEEIMRIIAEKTEKANKEKKANEGKAIKTVIPKAPKEPPLVPPNMLPDAYGTFLEREQQQYLDMLEEIYNPQNMKLTMDEINLRQYIMLGGLYSIMFVRRSGGTHFQKFNIMLHEDGRVLHIMHDIVADLRGPSWMDDETGRGSRTSKLSAKRSRLRIDDQKRKTLKLEDDELPYFFVTIQMPPELCMWGEPIPCQYITAMEDVESEISSVEERKDTIIVRKRKSKLGSIKNQSDKRRSQSIVPTQITRRDNATHNVFRPTLISLLRASRKLLPGERVIPVRNFQLVKLLNHVEVRQLQRYCVPRIISSFKFPIEVRAELEQQYDQRPKTKNVLIRRRSADNEEDAIVIGELDFDYDVQKAPERIFPVFQDLERVRYAEEHVQEQIFDKKSMYGLLDTFDNVTLRYTTRYRDIMNQPDFEFKKPTVKKIVVPAADVHIGSLVQRKSVYRSSKVSTHRVSHSVLAASTSSLRGSSRLTLADSDHDLDLPSPEVISQYDKEEDSYKGVKQQVKVTHWTTKHILTSKFDRQARTITIKTDRLGIFGFAYKRYDHFPFRDWSMQPNEDNNEEIILSVDTFRARVILYITAQGIRGYVTDITKHYVAHPVKYLEITTPISDFRQLRKRFYEKNINIFAEHDACYYIDNGYFSVKHMAMEDHTYDAMSLHCKLMKFYRSSWNRLASRRNILLGMKNAKDQSDYTEVTLRVTPDTVTFVEVSELCSDDLDVIKLDFKSTWRNMSSYTDLHQAINSMNPHATDVRNRDPLLLFQVKRMLNEIHLMSFS